MFNPKSFTNIILIAVVVLLVAVAGYFVFMKKSGPTAQQAPIVTPNQISAPVSLTPDEAAHWETYTNTKYGFEVKYPDYWEIDSSSWDTEDGIEYSFNYHYIPFLNISNGETKRIGLGIINILNGENYDFNSIADFRKWHDKYMGSGGIEKLERSKIGQLDAIRTYEVDGVSSMGEYVYITRDDLVIFLTRDSADDAQTQLTFNQLLTTFKFIK